MPLRSAVGALEGSVIAVGMLTRGSGAGAVHGGVYVAFTMP